MNKWFDLALKSVVGIILLNLIFGVLFGIGGFSIAGLFAFAIKILYVLLFVGLFAGIFKILRDFIFTNF